MGTQEENGDTNPSFIYKVLIFRYIVQKKENIADVVTLTADKPVTISGSNENDDNETKTISQNKITISEFNELKKDCLQCAGNRLCSSHQKIFEQVQ